MSTPDSEHQQWYIEEIPATESDEAGICAASSKSVCPSTADGVLQKTATALETLEIGSATLETAQSKAESVGSADEAEQAPFGDMARMKPAVGSRSWASTTFASTSSTQSPPPRGGCSWTKVGSKYLLFGGADACQQHFADVHCFDAATGTWEKMATKGSPPSPRSGHSAVALEASLLVYGGMNGQDGVTFNDLFELHTGTMEWTCLACKDAPPRNSHAAVLYGDTMIIIGGASPEGQTDDVSTVDLSDRLNLSFRRVCCRPLDPGDRVGRSGADANVPAAREMHTACLYDSKAAGGGEPFILLMGGRSADGVLRDLFSLSTDSWVWKRLKDAPVQRCAHSACFVGGIMAIHGGWDGGTIVADDVHLYDLQSDEWTTTSVSPRPPGRFAHAACTGMGKDFLVFGGVNPGADLTDVVVLTAF